MRWKVLMTVLIGMGVLCVSGCGSSRRAVTSEVRSRTAEVRVDSVVVGTMEAVHDTIVETTIITVDRNEVGDTLFRSVVTDRERLRDRSRADRATHRIEVRVDTVFVERRDSVLVKNTNQARASPFENTLKWGLFIVIALIGLILLLRIRR